jgi:lauroyl/myristoyl acyltransferase
MLSIGFKSARSLARWFARQIFNLNPAAKQTAMRHIRQAFNGERSEQECEALCKAYFEHSADFATEILYARRRLRPETFDRHVTLPDEWTKSRGLQPARPLKENTPAIFVTTYHGNPFIGALALAETFGQIDVVLDDWAVQALHSLGRSPGDLPRISILPRSQAAARLPKLLEEGRKVMLVGEHVSADQRGHRVTFLNTDQTGYPTIALLSLMHNAPIVVFAAERTGKNFHFQLRVEESIQPSDRHHAEPNLLTRQYMAALERIIRRTPEQYAWTRSWISQDS